MAAVMVLAYGALALVRTKVVNIQTDFAEKLLEIVIFPTSVQFRSV